MMAATAAKPSAKKAKRPEYKKQPTTALIKARDPVMPFEWLEQFNKKEMQAFELLPENGKLFVITLVERYVINCKKQRVPIEWSGLMHSCIEDWQLERRSHDSVLRFENSSTTVGTYQRYDVYMSPPPEPTPTRSKTKGKKNGINSNNANDGDTIESVTAAGV